VKAHISASLILSFCLVAASLGSSFLKSNAGQISRDVIEQLAFDVLLRGDKSERVVKRDGPIGVIATDKSGGHIQLVEDAVADINEAFGYGKIALRWTDEISTPKDDEIVFLLGSVSDGRGLIERAGVSSPGSFRSGSYRYWYKSHTYQSLTKGLVAIDASLPPEDISLLSRRYLLSVLGFRGSSRNLRDNESFFSPDYSGKRAQKDEDHKERKMLTETDSAMLKFADRWVAASMTWNKVRRVFDSRWSEAVESFLTPGSGELQNHGFDEAPGKIATSPTHTKQAESPSYPESPMKRDGVLACDVIVSLGNEKNATASVRLPKGSKGRIVEEQPHQILLFFGSDRLMYVPKEAVQHTGLTAPDEIRVELLKRNDSTERIAANGMLEKRFKLNVNQMQLFRNSGGDKILPVEAFAKAGARFPEGSAATLTSPSELVVRTTPTMMALVDAIMNAAKSSY
jgi:hypothetical protein